MKNNTSIVSIKYAVFPCILVIALATTRMSAAQKNGDSCERKDARVATSKLSPFACDRLALDPVARKRHFDELGPPLKGFAARFSTSRCGWKLRAARSGSA